MPAKFRSTMNSGFQIVFDNGWEVSVQFGHMNYCDNRKFDAPFNVHGASDFTECATAEVAVFTPDRKMLGDVMGYQTPDEVTRIMMVVASGEFINFLNNRNKQVTND